MLENRIIPNKVSSPECFLNYWVTANVIPILVGTLVLTVCLYMSNSEYENEDKKVRGRSFISQ